MHRRRLGHYSLCISYLLTPRPARDHELKQAVKDLNAQLVQATQSLAEFKHRALTAEVSSHIADHP